MLIELQHSFKLRCHNITELLDNCNKMATFCSRLEKQSIKSPDRYQPEKYCGDGFELFVEFFLKSHCVDNRIGVGSYQILDNDDTDTGVDGVGIGINNKPAAVQVKYRSNNNKLLTANEDHLTNFGYSAQNKYGIDLNDINNMLIITSAKGLHAFTNGEMLLGKVRCIGYDQLREMLDNNLLFWELFRLSCNLPH